MALESAVADASFLFWQYVDPKNSQTGCTSIPVNGTFQAAFDFLEKVNPISQYTDSEIGSFMPYDYQSATQLGGPENFTARLVDLLQFGFHTDVKCVNFCLFMFLVEIRMRNINANLRAFIGCI